MSETRRQILEALDQMSDLHPDWRFGQMVANVSAWAKGATQSAVWDVEDPEFLKAALEHLARGTDAGSFEVGDSI